MNGIYDNLLMSYFGSKQFKELADTTPFYIEDISGTNDSLYIYRDIDAPEVTVEYSTDGVTWVTAGATISQSELRIPMSANAKTYLRADTTTWSYRNMGVISHHSFRRTKNFNVGGNMASLVYGENFTGYEHELPISNYSTFWGLFQNCTKLISARELSIIALGNSSHSYLFSGCTNLVYAPELPVTQLYDGCYSHLFDGCAALTTPPVLSAMIMQTHCYSGMFKGCTSLASAPVLPSTTLAMDCYNNMFYGCTSLTTAPILPAETLYEGSYRFMFQSCTSLNYIKCLATDISAPQSTDGWVYNVSPSGTFIKASGMNDWGTNISGIPSGWTVQNA